MALALAGYSDAFFRMSCPGRLLRERIDPIVSSGKVAGHVHSVSGGSGWSPSMTFEDARSAKCTSCEIKVNSHIYLAWYRINSNYRRISPTTGRRNSMPK